MAEKDLAEAKAAPSPDSSTIVEAAPVVDPVVEKRILRKLDFHVIPVLWFLFLVSFVDRGNIVSFRRFYQTVSLGLKHVYRAMRRSKA